MNRFVTTRHRIAQRGDEAAGLLKYGKAARCVTAVSVNLTIETAFRPLADGCSCHRPGIRRQRRNVPPLSVSSVRVRQHRSP